MFLKTEAGTAWTGQSSRGDDYYRYANGGWLKTLAIPNGQTSYDNRALLTEKASRHVRDLIHDAAASNAAKGSVARKVGDYYASLVDEADIEAGGLTRLAGEMTKIAAIKDRSSLSACLGATLNIESDGLIANSDHVFGLLVNQGFRRVDTQCPAPAARWPGDPGSRQLPGPVPRDGRVARPIPEAHRGDADAGRRPRPGGHSAGVGLGPPLVGEPVDLQGLRSVKKS